MKLSPGSSKVAAVRNWTEWPLLLASAALHPSNAAIRSSKTETVGLVILE